MKIFDAFVLFMIEITMMMMINKQTNVNALKNIIGYQNKVPVMLLNNTCVRRPATPTKFLFVARSSIPNNTQILYVVRYTGKSVARVLSLVPNAMP